LHWWSRVWEYTFIYAAIVNYAKSGMHSFNASLIAKGISILDVGSGVTFLPYMLTQKIPLSKVDCLDYDTSYINYFNQLNNNMRTNARKCMRKFNCI
jgi:16S rRNA G1207 methylase RsmC